MSPIQRLVSPKLPTTLANHTHVDLPGYDIWLFYLDSVHVVPTELDVSKFEEALSRVLQLYPHAAGQLRCIDRRWSIELTNTPVPVDIDYKLDTSSDSLLEGDWVIQDDLSPFLNQQPIGANLVNGTVPLVRFKLTFFDHETCIGTSWCHSLGDGIMMSRFLHTLSQFYQGRSPEFGAPTFEKHHFPTPSHSVVAEFWPRMPHLHATFHSSERGYAESRKNIEIVRWRIDSLDIEELRSVLCSKRQNGPFLSKHDCLVAYLVSVLNYNGSNRVQKVTSITSYRNIRTPFFAENVASNLVLDVPANVPMDMAGIATAVRNALKQSREPDYIYDWVTLASHLKLDAANTGKSFPHFDDNQLIVGSTVVIDWWGAHFGCHDGTRFHMNGMGKLYVRFFRSNPAKRDDGVWQARSSIDISMGVPVGLESKLLGTLAQGIRHMLNDQHA